MKAVVNGMGEGSVDEPPELDIAQAYALVTGCRNYFGTDWQTYFSPAQMERDVATIDRLEPEAVVTVYDGTGLLWGVLKDALTTVTSHHSPFALSLVLTDAAGEIQERTALPGAITVHDVR